MKYFATLSETILVILILSFTVCPALGSDQSSRRNGNENSPENQAAFPGIRFDEMFFDIGKVNQHKTITHLFTFRNTGSGTLTIQKVKAG